MFMGNPWFCFLIMLRYLIPIKQIILKLLQNRERNTTWIISNVFLGFVRQVNWIQHSPAWSGPLVWRKSPVRVRWLLLKMRRKVFCQKSIVWHRDSYALVVRYGEQVPPSLSYEVVVLKHRFVLFTSEYNLMHVFCLSSGLFETAPLPEQKEKSEGSSEKQSNKEEHRVENRLRKSVCE